MPNLNTEEKRAVASLWVRSQAGKKYTTTWAKGHFHSVDELLVLGEVESGQTTYDHGHSHNVTYEHGYMFIESAEDGHSHHVFE